MTSGLQELISLQPSEHIEAANHRPTSETPFELRFACGLIVARDGILAGM